MRHVIWYYLIGWQALTSGANVAHAQATVPVSTMAEPSIPIGTWRTHFSYRNIRHLAVTPRRIYGAAANGLFYVSRDDNNLQLLTKNDGLSDVSVVALAYQPTLDALMLAYRSGRIDVLIDNQVVSFTLIQEASEREREEIYSIHWQENTAFVSTSQGVRVLTVQTGEGPAISIQESYTQLGAAGDALAVFDATTSGDSLFLATEEGIIANALNPATNRQDFSTWYRFGTAEGLPNGEVRHLANREGVIYAAFDTIGVYSYQSGNWQLTSLTTSQPFNSLQPIASGLIATYGNQVATLDDQGIAVIENSTLITGSQDAAVDEQGAIWIADQSTGLLRSENGTFTSYVPNGPATDDIAGVRFVNQQLVALGADDDGTFSTLTTGQWATFQLPSATARLTDAVFSTATRQYYLATFGNGLIQWNGEQDFTTIPSPNGSTAGDRLTSLASQNESFWVTRFGNTSSLLSFLPTENTWSEYLPALLNAAYPRKLAIDFSGNKWLITGDSSPSDPSGSDLLVFDEQEDQVQMIRSGVNSSDLPGNRFTDMVVDREGLVWIGGNQGVAYFPNPFGIFSEVVVVKPVVDRQFLLRDEYVTSLAVDGGNRKWVGTRNGVWLFSDTGEELIQHFTTANSPLISNTIRDITINDTDGEVFITTDRGLVSYRGTATQATAAHQAVKVFPNPVRSGFNGTVGIQGLASDATVKITTISGTLVQELQAQGGTATWDTRNYAGQRVSTGVYLLFSATTDGQETYVGKMAVIP